MHRKALLTAALLQACLVAPVCAQTPLKEAFKGRFRIGAALNPGHFTESDAAGAAIVKAHFNTITPENDMKWERIHPNPDSFNFGPADRYVKFGEKNGMFIVGHCLIWHNQTPRWVFQDSEGNPPSREKLLERMRTHILTIVRRYKGRVSGWDVVNEALNDDGTMRQSPWFKIIGEDYLAKAFEYAHEADPKAELYYNDYSLENEAKRKGAIELIRKLKAQGAHITAVGLQGHDGMNWPTVEQQDATITAFAALGIKVCITELDVDVLPAATRRPTAEVSKRVEASADLNPYTAGLPDLVAEAQAARYGALFQVFLKHSDAIERVTFWGVTDRVSWLNYFPVRGRTNYPLLFDREGKPKPAFNAVIRVAAASR